MCQAACSFIFLSLEKREWGLSLGVSTWFHSLVLMREQTAEDSLEEVKQTISRRFLEKKKPKQNYKKLRKSPEQNKTATSEMFLFFLEIL